MKQRFRYCLAGAVLMFVLALASAAAASTVFADSSPAVKITPNHTYTFDIAEACFAAYDDKADWLLFGKDTWGIIPDISSMLDGNVVFCSAVHNGVHTGAAAGYVKNTKACLWFKYDNARADVGSVKLSFDVYMNTPEHYGAKLMLQSRGKYNGFWTTVGSGEAEGYDVLIAYIYDTDGKTMHITYDLTRLRSILNILGNTSFWGSAAFPAPEFRIVLETGDTDSPQYGGPYGCYIDNLLLSVEYNESEETDDMFVIKYVDIKTSSMAYEVGRSTRLTADVFPQSDADQPLQWWSSDESVATVDQTGLVRMVKAGTAWIYAQSVSGASDSCRVDVVSPDGPEATEAQGLGRFDSLSELMRRNICTFAAGVSMVYIDGAGVLRDEYGEAVGDADTWYDIVSVAAATYKVYALRADGTIVTTDSANRAVLESWRNVAAISSSNYTFAALLEDGTVRTIYTGDDYHYGQTDGVNTWTDIVQIDADNDLTVGLTADDRVKISGGEYRDKLDGALLWTDIVDVATNGRQIVGVKADGTVLSVGYNDGGSGNVSGWNNIVDVECGSQYTLGLTVDGTVVTAGDNRGDYIVSGGWRNIVDIASGYYYALGLQSDGTIVASGYNDDSRAMRAMGTRDVLVISPVRRELVATAAPTATPKPTQKPTATPKPTQKPTTTPKPTATPQYAAGQTDEWLTTAIAKTKGFRSLEELMDQYDYKYDPIASNLRIGTLNYNEGGDRDDYSIVEASLTFPNGDIFSVELSASQARSLQSQIDAVFPYDFFNKLPGEYTLIEIEYLESQNTGIRRPNFKVTCSDFLSDMHITEKKDIDYYAAVIDTDNLLYVSVDPMVQAYVTGMYGGDMVNIETQFTPSDVFTTVTLFPAYTLAN